MKVNLFRALIWLTLTCLTLSSHLLAEGHPSELFSTLKLIYEDDFDASQIDTNFWQVRQGTTWNVIDGVLVGTPSAKEFQEKMIAAGDKAHAGFKPVIWLEKIPENLVVQFRVRFDANDYHPKFPLIDVGHHVNTLTFSATGTTLTLKKDQKVMKTADVTLAINQWADVTIELKQGVLVLKINDKKTVFSDPLIDMIGQQQIDFKGVDHGEIRIDKVKVFEGIP